MPSLKDIIRCPKCGGTEIVYSCEPKCCFNHVCSDCRSSFEINTQKTGQYDRTTPVHADAPASGDPTTACAACESLNLTLLKSDANETLLLCADCRTTPRVVAEEFVPGGF